MLWIWTMPIATAPQHNGDLHHALGDVETAQALEHDGRRGCDEENEARHRQRGVTASTCYQVGIHTHNA